MCNCLNIAKATTDPRVEFISQCLTHILIKFHLQNFEQVKTSKCQPNMNIWTKVKLQNIDQSYLKLNFKILTKATFRISTKIQLDNLYKTKVKPFDQTSASKSATNRCQHDPYH